VAFFMTTFMCSRINWFGDLNTISPDENHEREVVDDSVIFLHSELSSDSRSRSRSPANIHEKEVIDGSVSSAGYSPFPQKKKLFTLWDVDIYEEDVGNRPEDVEPSKPMRGSADDQDA